MEPARGIVALGDLFQHIFYWWEGISVSEVFVKISVCFTGMMYGRGKHFSVKFDLSVFVIPGKQKLGKQLTGINTLLAILKVVGLFHFALK